VQIRDYIAHWNSDPKPFEWTATAGEILAKVQLVQTNIKNSWPIMKGKKAESRDTRRRVSRVRDAVGHLEAMASVERADQLGDEERIAGGALR
jgi:hypothetical protein